MIEAIDFSKVYKIEAIPSKDSKELADKGLGTFPGIMQTVSACWNDTLKRYTKTGFDEYDTQILRLDPTKKKEVQERLVAKRTELENLIGSEGYLKATSDAWLTDLCMVQIEVGQDLKLRVNGHDNNLRPAESYKDAISLALIMAAPEFPKSKADISKPEYRGAKFYLTTAEETSEGVKTSLTKKKKAYVYLSDLFDDKKNKQRAWEVAFKVGVVNKQKIDADVLEVKLHDAIFNDKTGKTLDTFLEACELDKEILLIHNLFQQGINIGVIRVSPDGHYHRGHVNYRKTKQESIDYLLTPGNEVELGELKSEVEGRKKKHNAIG